MSSFSTNNNLGILTIRLSIGILMLLHGIAKINHGIDFITSSVEAQGLPGFFAYGVYIGEVLAPILIILGIKTRLAALIFAVNCVVAILLVHKDSLLSLNDTGGWAIELLGLYLFGAIALLFSGGGKYAITNKGCLD